MASRQNITGEVRAVGTASILLLALTAAQAPSSSADEENIRAQSIAFVRGTGVANGQTPAARWIDPVCPRVIGLRDDAARAAEARMRRVATEAGAEVATQPCNSNLVVTFTADPAALASAVYRLEPRQFAQLAPGRRDALLAGPAPVRWWYGAETRGRHGEGEREPGTSGQGQADNHGTMNSSYAFEGDTMRYDSSLISTFEQRALVSASVLVDLDSIMGMRLDSVADYAAFVGLAEIRNPDFAPEGSILGLFGSGPRPRGLTAFDRAFLRALYRLPLDREASRHRGGLVRDMTQVSAEN
ncbi:MAG: hypothetical protein ACXW2T_06360 [Allosphingosinicella sp.]